MIDGYTLCENTELIGTTKPKHTEREIIEALQVIQDVCREYDTCDDCPCSHQKTGNCIIGEFTPENWEIVNDLKPRKLLIN